MLNWSLYGKTEMKLPEYYRNTTEMYLEGTLKFICWYRYKHDLSGYRVKYKLK